MHPAFSQKKKNKKTKTKKKKNRFTVFPPSTGFAMDGHLGDQIRTKHVNEIYCVAIHLHNNERFLASTNYFPLSGRPYQFL